jgi:hypothetical protein
MGPMGFGPEGTSGLVSALAVTNAIAATLTATNPGALSVSVVFITILLLASSFFWTNQIFALTQSGVFTAGTQRVLLLASIVDHPVRHRGKPPGRDDEPLLTAETVARLGMS